MSDELSPNESARHSPEAQDLRAPGDRMLDDDAIRDLLTRLSRPHRTGGRVIERASLLAEGGDFAVLLAWIEAHGGAPEAPAIPRSRGGLHSARLATSAASTPLRFILPAGAFN